MKSKEEMDVKIEKLNDRIAGIRSADQDEISNEMKVILAGSELQSIMIASVSQADEETVRKLLKRFEDRGEELTKNYETASKYDHIEEKNKINAMIWTNDIRIDTLKWVLEEEEKEL